MAPCNRREEIVDFIGKRRPTRGRPHGPVVGRLFRAATLQGGSLDPPHTSSAPLTGALQCARITGQPRDVENPHAADLHDNCCAWEEASVRLNHLQTRGLFPAHHQDNSGELMEQRRLRLGDILDDYCPRERRVTNHAVVAMIDEDVKQTRCTTCDAEHVYKGGKPPRRKKAESTGALYKEVLAGLTDQEAAATRALP